MDMDMSPERWAPVPDWEGVYAVSDAGRVRRERPAQSTAAGRVIRPLTVTGGARVVYLSRPGRRDCCSVARLVATVFVGPAPHRLAIVGHRDGDQGNCRAQNLHWTTMSARLGGRPQH